MTVKQDMLADTSLLFVIICRAERGGQRKSIAVKLLGVLTCSPFTYDQATRAILKHARHIKIKAPYTFLLFLFNVLMLNADRIGLSG